MNSRDSDAWSRLQELFEAAKQHEPAGRGDFLARACAGDEPLRRRVEQLLAAAEQAESFLEQAPSAVAIHTSGSVDSSMIGRRVGRFTIRSVIASGGMGTVYRAEQEHPKRNVALKVMKEGLASPSLRRRFEFEVQVLGQLEHPGIARIYEAGTLEPGTPGGSPLPFFAMELVEGQPLTAYAKQHQQSRHQRLELLACVCDAVQHAHQKGVIHRDLKPANILVDRIGKPKVLDFGIARATDADIRATTLQTDIGQLIGTLPYMSPEQAAGDPTQLDARSDIYSLGVVGYELLCGHLPYDLSAQSVANAVRIIGEKDPAPLSSVSRVFRGDIDTIVAKALEKDKTRRYQSVSDLGADIRRYLADEPIVARPASASYKLGKFAKRHKGVVAALTLTFLVLLAGVVATGWQAVQALHQRDRALAAERIAEDRRAQAQREAQKAQRIQQVLENMLEASDPWRAQDREVTVREVLDNAAATLGTDLVDQPEVEAAVRSTLGSSYFGLGQYDEANKQFRAALTIRRHLLGDDHPDVARSMHDLGALLGEMGDFDQAETMLTEALELRRSLLGQKHPDVALTLYNLASVNYSQGRFDQAQALARQTLAIQTERLTDPHKVVADTLNLLAGCVKKKGRFAEAEQLYRRALDLHRKLLGQDHPDVAVCLNNLGMIAKALGRYDEAEDIFRQALRIIRQAVGTEHPYVAMFLNNLADVLMDKGDHDAAEPLYRQALELGRKSLGDTHPFVIMGTSNLAELLREQGDHQAAEPLYRWVIEQIRTQFGEQHSMLGTPLYNLGNLLRTQGHPLEAEQAFREALAYLRQRHGEKHPKVAKCLSGLADALSAQGRYDEAKPMYAQALEIAREALGDDHIEVAWILQGLGRLHLARNDVDTAEPLLRQSVQIGLQATSKWHWTPAVFQTALGECLTRMGRNRDAEDNLLQAYETLNQSLGREHQKTLNCVEWLVRLYEAWPKPDQAARWRAKLPPAQPAAPDDGVTAGP